MHTHSNNKNIDLASLGIKSKDGKNTDLFDLAGSDSPFRALVTEDEMAELEALSAPPKRSSSADPAFP
jgi:hypothetical protein